MQESERTHFPGKLATTPLGRSELQSIQGPRSGVLCWPLILGRQMAHVHPRILRHHHPRFPREGPASPSPHDDSLQIRPHCIRGSSSDPEYTVPFPPNATGQGATAHPLPFEWQHYSFTQARLPYLPLLVCQTFNCREKCISLHPFFSLPLCSPLASQTCLRLFPGLHPPHPTNSSCPTPF